MSAIDRIVEKLVARGMEFQSTQDHVEVPPRTPGGFSVTLSRNRKEFIVSFDGWHEHFTEESRALECFAFGFSSECRIRVELRGSLPYRWTLEYLRGNDWVPDSTVGTLPFQFWRKRRVEYLQNPALDEEMSGQGS